MWYCWHCLDEAKPLLNAFVIDYQLESCVHVKTCALLQFSMTCPLITPAGTLFCAVKHFVDRHNLMYVYKRSKINKNVHETAIGYVVLRFVKDTWGYILSKLASFLHVFFSFAINILTAP